MKTARGMASDRGSQIWAAAVLGSTWPEGIKRLLRLTMSMSGLSCLSLSILISASMHSLIANLQARWQISVKSAPLKPCVILDKYSTSTSWNMHHSICRLTEKWWCTAMETGAQDWPWKRVTCVGWPSWCWLVIFHQAMVCKSAGLDGLVAGWLGLWCQVCTGKQYKGKCNTHNTEQLQIDQVIQCSHGSHSSMKTKLRAFYFQGLFGLDKWFSSSSNLGLLNKFRYCGTAIFIKSLSGLLHKFKHFPGLEKIFPEFKHIQGFQGPTGTLCLRVVFNSDLLVAPMMNTFFFEVMPSISVSSWLMTRSAAPPGELPSTHQYYRITAHCPAGS